MRSGLVAVGVGRGPRDLVSTLSSCLRTAQQFTIWVLKEAATFTPRKQFMNNFLYLISDLPFYHLPIMSPPSLYSLGEHLSSSCLAPSLTLYMAMSFFFLLPPCVVDCLSWYLVEANFYEYKTQLFFYEVNVEHHSGTPFAFSWDTQPGAECLFDHSPFPYCKYIHFHL